MDDDDKGNGLLDAARGLANAFSDLLNSLKPGEGKVGACYQRVFKTISVSQNYKKLETCNDFKK